MCVCLKVQCGSQSCWVLVTYSSWAVRYQNWEAVLFAAQHVGSAEAMLIASRGEVAWLLPSKAQMACCCSAVAGCCGTAVVLCKAAGSLDLYCIQACCTRHVDMFALPHILAGSVTGICGRHCRRAVWACPCDLKSQQQTLDCSSSASSCNRELK